MSFTVRNIHNKKYIVKLYCEKNNKKHILQAQQHAMIQIN